MQKEKPCTPELFSLATFFRLSINFDNPENLLTIQQRFSFYPMASQVVAQLQNFQTSQKILISDTNCSICPETKTVSLAHTTNVDHAIFNTQHPLFLLVLVPRQGVEDLSRIFSGLCISIIQPSPLSSL